MIRAFHRWPGLVALLVLALLGLSGAALSVYPATERLSAPQAAVDMSVADLTARIQASQPGVEQIRRAPSGRIVAYWFDQGVPGSAVIDPETGQPVASADPDPVERWLTTLHRSFFAGDTGRIVTALGAGAMLVLALSGVALVARRAGGYARWFAPLRGPLSGRIHVEIARLSVIGLALSSVTALWMSAATFDLIPVSGHSMRSSMPAVSGLTGIDPAQIDTLRQTPVAQLRDLTFPYPGDATDVFTLTTQTGTVTLDQGTGAVVSQTALTLLERIDAVVIMLHTGRGAPLLGVVLGLMALGIPALGITGVTVWLTGRRGRPRLRHNARAAQADTILLVGSEGGSTWGFATTLHSALTEAGLRVHVAPMSSFAPARYGAAQRILALAATYGDGAAPASARGFLPRLAEAPTGPRPSLSVLGFGDRSFPGFCAFADEVEQAARAAGWPCLVPMDRVDRQSPQDFARWGRALGEAIGIPLDLAYHATTPAVETLTLISRQDFGDAVQAPTTILRFAVPPRPLWPWRARAGFSRFDAGDLVGILPEGSAVPRFYSLASARRDGVIELVVKRHPGGLCSGQLTTLEPGETVRAFLRRNPGFRPGRGRAPLILIGAGTGVGPMAGFIRANRAQRPIHLFFGLRHPDSDFLYRDELADWAAQGRLTRLVTAVSRGRHPRHVQDALRIEATQIADLVRAGAKVMVCGGRGMAAGVTEALTEILAPSGLTPALLKSEGRYVEDVY
ncbi:MAG: PepSY domain-containing protein [Paracoccaceae bacterium]